MASSVYTKTGDAGTTGLYTGERVQKSSLRVEELTKSIAGKIRLFESLRSS